MNGFKALGLSFIVIASALLIFGFYSGWTSHLGFLHTLEMWGGTVEPIHYWYNFWYPFTPYALQAVAFYVLGGVSVFYGRHKQKTLKKQQALRQHGVSSKPESPNSVSFTYCPFCGKELPQGTYPLCPFCGKSFEVFHK